MTIVNTTLKDVYLVKPQVYEDSRGYFFEGYNKDKFKEANLLSDFVQDNQSKSDYGVIRGLHYQLEPYAQTKLVRVLQGKVLDVVVDIRKGSPDFGKHEVFELSEENKEQLYIPKGFAHGFSVITETAVVFYKCDNFYQPDAERGIMYNDPELSINWGIPINKAIISKKDSCFPFMNQAEMNFIYKG
jgi:dTDP-4-dehydrorhamnose 3,5-epimerase